jgi:hypothetical protein
MRKLWGVYVFSVAALLCASLFWVLIGDFVSMIIQMVAVPALALSTLGLVIGGLRKSVRVKWHRVAGAVVLVIAMAAAEGFLRWWPGVQVFYWSRSAGLNSFAEDVVSYERITEIAIGWNGQAIRLNGTQLAGADLFAFDREYNTRDKAVIDTVSGIFEEVPGIRQYDTVLFREYLQFNPAISVDTVAGTLEPGPYPVWTSLQKVLERDGIERERYEEFTTRLNRLGIGHVEVEEGQVRLTIPNQAGSYWLVFVSDTSGVDRGSASELRHVAGSWYFQW